MDSVVRRIVIALAFAVLPLTAHAAVNLQNFGGGSNTPVLTTGGGDLPTGPVVPPPPTGGGGGAPIVTITSLQAQGYACAAQPGPDVITAKDVVCSSCALDPFSETQTCSAYRCQQGPDTCNASRLRYGVPRDVNPSDLGWWAKEFAFGSLSYSIRDVDGDGRRDIVGDMGAQGLRAGVSQGTFFKDGGFTTSSAPVESAGPMAMFDVNQDGIPDVLSVSPAGHLVAGISTGSGIAAQVELTNTWCEGLGDCLIGDVDGDGMPDLVEVMRGAVSGQRTGDVWVSRATSVPGFPAVPSAPTVKDTDGDGVLDNVDTCIDLPNPNQLDSDGDGIGNACDADLNGDGIVNQADVDAFLTCLGADVTLAPQCAKDDLDGDGFIGFGDAGIMQASLGQPPGRAASNQSPQVELFTPADGTILPTGSAKAWVAGWVPNLPPGGVQVLVNGQAAAVSGPSNYFAAFVDLAATYPNGTPKVFHGIVVDASRGTRHTTVRRSVAVGDHAAPLRRASTAVGARLTAPGLERVEQFVQTKLVPDALKEMPKRINGFTAIMECPSVGGVILPVCATGATTSGAVLGDATVSANFEPGALHLHASLTSIDLELSIEGFGPTPATWHCGGHVKATGIEVDVRYGLGVENGKVKVDPLGEPVVSANISYDGCSGDKVKDQVLSKLETFATPIGDGIESVFAGLDLSGTFTEDLDLPVLTTFSAPSQLPTASLDTGALTMATSASTAVKTASVATTTSSAFTTASLSTTAVPLGTVQAAPAVTAPAVTNLGPITTLGQDLLSLLIDARFESVPPLDASGVSIWLGLGIDPVTPVAGLGSPSGAYQVPGLVAPALPSTLASGSPYDVGAAVTPNGLNELLDALTRAGELAKQGRVITQITNPLDGSPTDLTGFLLGLVIDAFKAYPAFEKFSVHVTPPPFAPVVTGQRGPGNEAVDVHVSQLGITIRDESGDVAVALRADVRVGLNVGLAPGGKAKLSATAGKFEVLDFAVTENPINADPAQVGLRILCQPAIPSDAFGCALKDQLQKGLDFALGEVELPSVAKSTNGFALAGKCLQRLDDGTLMAQFGLVLPGEPLPPTPTGVVSVALDTECTPSVATPFGGTVGGGGATVGGGLGGAVVNGGVLQTAPVTTSPTTPTLPGAITTTVPTKGTTPTPTAPSTTTKTVLTSPADTGTRVVPTTTTTTTAPARTTSATLTRP